MAYIKISDPSVVDLAAWHQVINVVNQHSDTLNAVTSNFGATPTGTVVWDATDNAHEYNAVSHKIVFGRANASVVLTPTDRHTPYDSASSSYYGNIKFADVASGSTNFSAEPIITATAYSGSGGSGSASYISNANNDVIISVYNVSVSGFNYRLYRAKSNTTSTPITGDVHINWMAIGPR